MRTLKIILDYRKAATRKLLGNISAAAFAGGYLWTASDEGRTIECLEPSDDGTFRLRKQVHLDRLFPGLPGRKTGDEADLEALAVDGDELLVCGSHSDVRVNRKSDVRVEWKFGARPSRCLLGKIAFDSAGTRSPGVSLPFKGPASLRKVLSANRYIAPFIDLPCKENGLDIEGLCVLKDQLYVGLRGPVVNSIALVAELPSDVLDTPRAEAPNLHFLRLGGLGVRDLAVYDGAVIVLAGPVSSADGPFSLFRWRPKRSKKIQRPKLLWEWQETKEHPEGICVLKRGRKDGLMIVYDSPGGGRIKGSRYTADWISLASLGL